jgi:hypothetical protein
MIAIFSADDLVPRKWTVTGIAQEMSESLVASMFEGTNFELQQEREDRKKDWSRQTSVKLKYFGREIGTHLLARGH